MLKINYPATEAEVTAFNDRYVALFDVKSLQASLSRLFAAPRLVSFRNKRISKILISPIETLLKDSSDLNKAMTPEQKTELKSILNYDKAGHGKAYQSTIADFFMRSPEINISTCFFCNIDYINSYGLIGDYSSGLDFVKKGSKTEFLKIAGIGKVAADKIIKARAGISSLEDLPVSGTIKENLEKLNVKEIKNLFTLDHVLDKGTHPLAALSLYNFVPSCYNCNSKIKGSKTLVDKDAALSPTSRKFSLPDTVRFKLYSPDEEDNKFNGIKTTADFSLNFDIGAGGSMYKKYIDLFALKPRYDFHKREALDLIAKRKRYSDSQIREIARITSMPEHQVRKDIFGEELFEQTAGIKSLTKFRRDIARQMGIEGVL